MSSSPASNLRQRASAASAISKSPRRPALKVDPSGSEGSPIAAATASPARGSSSSAAASSKQAPEPSPSRKAVLSPTGMRRSSSQGSDPVSSEAALLALQDPEKKWRSWRVRFWTTWAMLGGFILLVATGHNALLGFVILLQTVMFKEIVSLGHVLSRENKLPGFRHLQWFWYATAQFFTYTRLVKHVSPSSHDNFLVARSSFLTFVGYATGVVGFVFSLKKGHYKYQFGMFSWCHLTLVLVVVQSYFLVLSMFEGIFWFIFPALLIVNNDIWAYFFGFFWGRTPLIKLSPKKTWEGFIGATFTTLIVGFVLPRILLIFDLMVCPKEGFSWDMPHCEHGHAYIPVPYALPEFLARVLQQVGLTAWTHVNIAPVQWHGMVMAAFASIIAPFGGFFASGFKRAFKIKDFGESIPGHGGVTDRMDCQIMMGLFAYVYYHAFVSPVTDLTNALYYFDRLNTQDQVDAFRALASTLITKGVLGSVPALNLSTLSS